LAAHQNFVGKLVTT